MQRPRGQNKKNITQKYIDIYIYVYVDESRSVAGATYVWGNSWLTSKQNVFTLCLIPRDLGAAMCDCVRLFLTLHVSVCMYVCLGPGIAVSAMSLYDHTI